MNSKKSLRRKYGSALLIVLCFVTLISVLVISLLISARFERTASSLALGRTQASLLADYGADLAVGRLREAIDAGRQFDATKYTTWASEPGRIRVFTIQQGSGAISHEDKDMFSAPPGPDAESANVDLNKALLSGIHPITGNAPGEMKVGWKQILANPNDPNGPSKTNPAVARIAYWVDDESCKVNVNTADGSHKVFYRSNGSVESGEIGKSYGFGTPSEINLQAFPGITKAMASAIADYAATIGFNSIAELGRVPNDPPPASFYTNDNFNLTCTSRTPELNMFGEPRIYLFPAVALNWGGQPQCAAVGGYGNYRQSLLWNGNISVIKNVSGPINFIYPISAMAPADYSWLTTIKNQLPMVPQAFTRTVDLPLPQCLAWRDTEQNLAPQDTNWNSRLTNYPLGQRIAKYLEGYNSQNQPITWPRYPGSTVNGFLGKYSKRQINSIALQIIDLASAGTVLADQGVLYNYPSYMTRGFLPVPNPNDPVYPNDPNPPSLVYGLSRGPKVTEIRMKAEPVPPSDIYGNGTSVPALKLQVIVESYLPTFYAGVPLDYNIDWLGDMQWGTYGGNTTPKILNEQDTPFWNNSNWNGAIPTPISTNPPSEMNTLWGEKFLTINDQNGAYAGVDLVGWPSYSPNASYYPDPSKPVWDPNQAFAQQYHPYLLKMAADGVTPLGYIGANNTFVERAPVLAITGPGSSSAGLTWSPGSYHSSANPFRDFLRPASPTTTSYQIRGGVAVYTRNGGGAPFWEVAPLDSLRGRFTGELDTNSQIPPALRDTLKDAVIPISFDVPADERVTFSAQVSDPLVNKFPGDWKGYLGDSSASVAEPEPNWNSQVYRAGGASAQNPDFPTSENPSNNPQNITLPSSPDGDNIGYKPVNGGDPLSVWLPVQDIRMPKQARLPSIGALNVVRTGMIPEADLVDGVPVSAQHGTPWRSISFDATSKGQATTRGRYPDWAMLDLFTVPFLPQQPYLLDANGNPSDTPPPIRLLTSGGSTEGRLNVNNPKTPYPFSENYPGVTQTPPERTLPLKALFFGLKPSNSYDGSSNPIYSSVDADALVTAVQNYLAVNGPFMVPGELADLDAMSDYTYRGVATEAQSRNDLLKNMIGAVCTQSNTYSIWVVAQTFKKAAKNTDYSKFEPGDIITGQVRKHFIVERFIETGKDGVPGNASGKFYDGRPAAGNDEIVGTSDDEIDQDFNPTLTYPLPYRWRIRSSEIISS